MLDEFGLFLGYMMIAAMLRLSYELGSFGQRSSGVEHGTRKPQTMGSNPSATAEESARVLSPERIEEIKRRELRRYQEAQDRKWERWFESVYK